MITERKYQEVAASLGIEVAMVKAVASVESGGSGFFADGKLRILFEPAIFWQELKQESIDPKKYAAEYKDVLWEKWNPKGYGLFSSQWPKLERASRISKKAAYKSASWGKFQPLGKFSKECGYADVFQMVEGFKRGEEYQLDGFAKMLIYRNLHIKLRDHDYAGFALAYNGRGYAAAPGRVNDYDYKIKKMYEILTLKK